MSDSEPLKGKRQAMTVLCPRALNGPCTGFEPAEDGRTIFTEDVAAAVAWLKEKIKVSQPQIVWSDTDQKMKQTFFNGGEVITLIDEAFPDVVDQ